MLFRSVSQSRYQGEYIVAEHVIRACADRLRELSTKQGTIGRQLAVQDAELAILALLEQGT